MGKSESRDNELTGFKMGTLALKYREKMTEF